jgi:diguanylate cyclase (GGDEF)-like protein
MAQATLLAVDDEPFFLHLYKDTLKQGGFLIETASSGKAAIERIQRGGIDIVLTDMVMPEIDGLEVLRVARATSNPPDVILLTGHATTESAIQALKNGARDYITKPFNPDELLHLVHTCIEQRRLLNENTLLKSQIQLFQRGQNLASLIDLERLLPQTLNTFLQEFGGGRGFAFISEREDRPDIKAQASMNDDEARALALSLPVRPSELTTMRLLGENEFTPQPGWPQNIHRLALFPLLTQGIAKGIVVVCNPSRSATFPKEPNLDNLQFLAEQCSLGFENACRFSGARELIYTDDLTGLFNHRYLHLAIEKEIGRSHRYGMKFSLIFIDLDHFKEINDTHGHLCGSKTLAEVAQVLRHNVREVDTLFRYGGDEFTALLVETDAAGAEIVAERMRSAIANTPYLQEEGICARVTATFGYSTFPDHSEERARLIDLADQAMFAGKLCRNAVRAAGETPR